MSIAKLVKRARETTITEYLTDPTKEGEYVVEVNTLGIVESQQEDICVKSVMTVLSSEGKRVYPKGRKVTFMKNLEDKYGIGMRSLIQLLAAAVGCSFDDAQDTIIEVLEKSKNSADPYLNLSKVLTPYVVGKQIAVNVKSTTTKQNRTVGAVVFSAMAPPEKELAEDDDDD